MTPHALVDRLAALGWFEGLPEAERDRIATVAAGYDLTDPEAVAAIVATVVVPVDEVDDAGGCAALLGRVASAAPFAFAPEGLEAASDDEGIVTVRFRAGGRGYAAVFDPEEDDAVEWLVTLVDGVLADAGKVMRMVALFVEEGRAHSALVAPAAVERARGAGVLPVES